MPLIPSLLSLPPGGLPLSLVSLVSGDYSPPVGVAVEEKPKLQWDCQQPAVAEATESRSMVNGRRPLRRGGARRSPSSDLPAMECVASAGGGGLKREVMTSAISMESLNSVSTSDSATSNSVRTLFVSGLPMDAKPRELYLLFRAYRGYESSLLKMTAKGGKPTSPVGFVTFVTRQDADDARKQLQGVRFDPDCAQVLRLELAKSNTKVSRPKQSPPPHMPLTASAPISALPQFLTPLQHEVLLDQHQLLLDQQQQLLALSALPQLSHAQALQAAYLPAAAAMQIPQQHAAIYAAAAAAAAAAANPPGSTPPACSTLFVANLSANVNEDELRSIFKAFPGFTRLRMHTKNGSSVAFVEYCDLRNASQAMLSLQGFQSSSADRGGLRIEYARNKMADVNG